jgi:hypothetical protein
MFGAAYCLCFCKKEAQAAPNQIFFTQFSYPCFSPPFTNQRKATSSMRVAFHHLCRMPPPPTAATSIALPRSAASSSRRRPGRVRLLPHVTDQREAQLPLPRAARQGGARLLPRAIDRHGCFFLALSDREERGCFLVPSAREGRNYFFLTLPAREGATASSTSKQLCQTPKTCW